MFQLAQYRAKVVMPVVAVVQAGEKWQDLDVQYGLEDMFKESSVPVRVLSLEQEYGNYIHAQLSVKGTDLLQHWQACASFVTHFLELICVTIRLTKRSFLHGI